MAKGPSATEARHLRLLFGVGTVAGLSDGFLLERFATHEGDSADLAFAALVERHGPMVLRVARAVLRDEHGSHDAFQATFLILARKARSLWVRETLGPWLHAVAYRVASESRSAEARRKRHEKGAARPEAFEPRPVDDLVGTIREEVERLPGPYREAVVLCLLDGLTQHEAAGRLGWPVGTLQSRLARGRQRLRDRLRRRGLAPLLGALAVGLPSVPEALIAATARAAVTLRAGGMIAPSVLAMIDATTKGMLMTKLKFGAAAVVVMVGGLVASTMGPGVGRPARATEEPMLKSELTDNPVALKKAVEVEGPIPPLDLSPGIPVLYYFYAKRSEPCERMLPAVRKLMDKGYPVTWIDVDISPKLAAMFRVDSVPAFILIDDERREVARVRGEMPAEGLAARLYRALSGQDARDGRIPAETPAVSPPSIPKPWATAVRVKIQLSDQAWGFASGTVIRSSPEESIILTCAHGFKAPDRSAYGPENFKLPVTVDLFDDQLTGSKPAMVHCIQQDVNAEVVTFDLGLDLCLLRIKPGRVLSASPVVPIAWKPSRGMKMIAVGCSKGNDATAWDTTILDDNMITNRNPGNQMVAVGAPTFKCEHRPREGRSGGGLFTSDGYLAGLNFQAVPNDDAGLYAAPDAIRTFLDRNKLSELYENDSDEPGLTLDKPAIPAKKARTLEPIPSPAVSDQDRRLNEVERKLDQILDALKAIKDDSPKILGDFPPIKR